MESQEGGSAPSIDTKFHCAEGTENDRVVRENVQALFDKYGNLSPYTGEDMKNGNAAAARARNAAAAASARPSKFGEKEDDASLDSSFAADSSVSDTSAISDEE